LPKIFLQVSIPYMLYALYVDAGFRHYNPSLKNFA
jgi:hypothetical protein